MSDKTAIEWTDSTWNPLRGCSRVSEGCRHCYAETVAARFSGPGLPYEGLIAKGGQWNGQIKLVPELLDQPLRWRKPRRIFVNSMSDLFHDKVPASYIDQVFAVMALCPHHTFQVLTKRPDRMLDYLSHADTPGKIGSAEREFAPLSCQYRRRANGYTVHTGCARHLPMPNVWLGVSVEDQKTADERAHYMRELADLGWITWVSYEPALGPVQWGPWMEFLRWAVCGGESGREARPMHPEWARSLRDQCAASGVPFLFKQWGEWAPRAYQDCGGIPSSGYIHPTLPRGRLPRPPKQSIGCYGPAELERQGCAHIAKVGKKAAGRLLDGVQHDGYPEVAHG